MSKTKGKGAQYWEAVAQKVIDGLRDGTAPWIRPWEPGELAQPYNPISGTRYRGNNVVMLIMANRSDPRWLTFRQAKQVDAHVNKGQRGVQIVYWQFEKKVTVTKENGQPILNSDGKPMTEIVKVAPRMFLATVFNAEQITGLPPHEKTPVHEWARHERAEKILERSGAVINWGGNRAFYRPATDTITMPERNQFRSADGYYATALHELGHWTGHETRLNRKFGRFRSEAYAREELRAEIASLMVGSEIGIGHDPGQHIAYVGSWIKVLEKDPDEIFKASKAAQEIRDMIISFERELELDGPEIKAHKGRGKEKCVKAEIELEL